ncbi:MAG: beta-phosphoglucomutase [Chloroflexi bacterium]|nr:beta-phosphoglucomutase [Chloroflexota bacterium]
MELGFIFDLDGVITDTAEYHYQAWKQVADEENIPFTRQDNEALRGVPRRRSLELLLKGRVFPEDKLVEMETRKNTYYQALLENITPDDLLPGVFPFLTEAQVTGIRLGLGSASKNAMTVIRRLGIEPLFDAIGDGYCVVNHKPAPDLFIWVAGRLGLWPTHCFVFEDAEAGVDAAIAGGFHAVGIGPDERVGRAHYVLPEGLKTAHIHDFHIK